MRTEMDALAVKNITIFSLPSTDNNKLNLSEKRKTDSFPLQSMFWFVSKIKPQIVLPAENQSE